MNSIRYFKLKNDGGFVARIKVLYKNMNNEGGNVSYDAEWIEWEMKGYDDICVCGERTVDLKDVSEIKEGAVVKLKAVVVLGKDKIASEVFDFYKDASDMATYRISGTTLKPKLSLQK